MRIFGYSRGEKIFLFERMRRAFRLGRIIAGIVLLLFSIFSIKAVGFYEFAKSNIIFTILLIVIIIGGIVANWSIMNAKRNIEGKGSLYITKLGDMFLLTPLIILAPFILIFNILEYLKLKKELT